MSKILLLVVVIGVVVFLALRIFSGSRSSTPSLGTIALDFTLPSQEGTPVHLQDYRGKWVVLYFYPKDQTAGCTREAHNFQRDLEKYEALNAVVLGVSLDTT